MSVTSGCVSLGGTVLATGARDYETILWDIESQKKSYSRRIDRNMVTHMKWLPSEMNTFVQCSEDRRMRLYDIREDLAVQQEIIVGDNFAGTCDVDESSTYIVTGHSGFNNSGCFVKLWDIRKMSDSTVEPVFQNEHSFSVVSARFLYTPERDRGEVNIISASADMSMKVMNLEGDVKSSISCSNSYSTMSPLKDSPTTTVSRSGSCSDSEEGEGESNRSESYSGGEAIKTDTFVVAGTTAPQLITYAIDSETLSIVQHGESTNLIQ